ncbi:MAG: 2OG-Fe(II) oxygenase [Bryobacterales bacterium]|nr:2OG-Fe(II) oxygenase [Bryobacterales bacterium]
MQTRPMVVPLRQGDGVVFAVRNRPVQGARGLYRTNLRHGVSRIRSGNRHTPGIVFAARNKKPVSTRRNMLTGTAVFRPETVRRPEIRVCRGSKPRCCSLLIQNDVLLLLLVTGTLYSHQDCIVSHNAHNHNACEP